MLKETVGISYNNLTTYLIDNNVPEIERRRILITGKVNFSVIVLERNCYFLVVLKRSRRDRRRKISKQIPFAPVVSPAYLLQMHRFEDFAMMNEDYVNAVLNWNQVFYSPVNGSFPTVENGGSRALCEDCMKAEKQGVEASFHFCIYDDVVAGGFRSALGPISRPL